MGVTALMKCLQQQTRFQGLALGTLHDVAQAYLSSPSSHSLPFDKLCYTVFIEPISVSYRNFCSRASVYPLPCEPFFPPPLRHPPPHQTVPIPEGPTTISTVKQSEATALSLNAHRTLCDYLKDIPISHYLVS